MSESTQFFIGTLIIYFAYNTIACWSLNLQFGVTGVMNFAFVIFQAFGAYVTALFSIRPASVTRLGHYIGGWPLPWPLPLILACLLGALFALIVGVYGLRPRRTDFQGILLFLMSIAATTLVITESGFLNGTGGLYDVAKPFRAAIGGTEAEYGWFLAAVIVGIAAAVYLLVIRRIDKSPWSNVLRSVRGNPDAAAALGTNANRERLKVLVLGGALAALSGGLLVEFISAYSPSAWTYTETFFYFIALVVGGLGNSIGAMVGSAVVLTGVVEGVQFLPEFNSSTLPSALQFVGLGLLIVLVLWFVPRGVLPERPRAWARKSKAIDMQGASTTVPGNGAAPGAVPEPASPASARGRVLVAAASRERDLAGNREDVLIVDDVCKKFGGVQALAGATLTIQEGAIVALIGPNGAGKTTLLNVVAGALSPTSGRVFLRDKDVTGLPAHKMAQLGVMRTFQQVGEFGRLTVAENLVLGGQRGTADTLVGAIIGRRSWGKIQDERLVRARQLLQGLNMLHLWGTYMGELSGGQKRIIEITRCLMRDPALLLLDEPFAGLSPIMVSEIEGYLAQLRTEGHTVVLVEHQLSVVERLADSVVMLANGSVLATGTMDELRSRKDVVDAYLS